MTRKMTKRPLTQQNTRPKKKKKYEYKFNQHCYLYD